MKLSECTIGTLVIESSRLDIPKSQRQIGHVTGLTVNPNGEVIPVVHFANEKDPRGCHHGNIERYLD